MLVIALLMLIVVASFVGYYRGYGQGKLFEDLRKYVETVVPLIEENKMLRSLLAEECFYADKNNGFRREGYTLFTEHGTAHRDINYRDCQLYETAEEAVSAAIEEHKRWNQK